MGGENLFAERRQIMERMGLVYQAIRKTYGNDVLLEVIDPRNVVVLLVILLREGIKNRIGWRKMLRAVVKGFNPIALFVGGDLCSYGEVPAIEAVMKRIEEERTRSGRVNVGKA